MSKQPRRFWTSTSPRRLRVPAKHIHPCDLCGTKIVAGHGAKAPIFCSNVCRSLWERTGYVLVDGVARLA